ncbi:MAG: hypothetical protein DRJ50_10835 [Actinobacteria bacterium]|nr:MAG: hypothetical protein DRJ50_10835 [Actinomycetota bacterium]
MQIGRNVTDPVDGYLADKRLLILDRDAKFTSAFRDLLSDSGVEVVRLPPRSPNLNAYAERNHQGLDNRLIDPGGRPRSDFDPIRCIESRLEDRCAGNAAALIPCSLW